MTKHSVTIKQGDTPWHQHVEVDGHDISHALRAATVRYVSGELPHVEVELATSIVEMTQLDMPHASVLMAIQPEVYEALMVLGWTPPDELVTTK